MPESPQMTVLNLVLGGTIFTEGGHYSPVNKIWGDILGRDTVQYTYIYVYIMTVGFIQFLIMLNLLFAEEQLFTVRHMHAYIQ